jgi:hypothetical protein
MIGPYRAAHTEVLLNQPVGQTKRSAHPRIIRSWWRPGRGIFRILPQYPESQSRKFWDHERAIPSRLRQRNSLADQAIEQEPVTQRPWAHNIHPLEALKCFEGPSLICPIYLTD